MQEPILKKGALRRDSQRVTTRGLLQQALCYSGAATEGLLQPALHHRGGRYGQHSTTAEALQAALYSGVAAITISNQSSN